MHLLLIPVKFRKSSGQLFLDWVAPVVMALLVTTYMHSRLHPSASNWRTYYWDSSYLPEATDYGAPLRVSCPISLRIRLAGTAPRIAEPLLGCGKAGKAIEISIRALGHHSL